MDEATADAIRRLNESSGELAAVVELRQYFPLFEISGKSERLCRWYIFDPLRITPPVAA